MFAVLDRFLNTTQGGFAENVIFPPFSFYPFLSRFRF
jgi:hypothetical protein